MAHKPVLKVTDDQMSYGITAARAVELGEDPEYPRSGAAIFHFDKLTPDEQRTVIDSQKRELKDALDERKSIYNNAKESGKRDREHGLRNDLSPYPHQKKQIKERIEMLTASIDKLTNKKEQSSDESVKSNRKSLKGMSDAEIKQLRVIMRILPDGTLWITEEGKDSLERNVASWNPPNRPDMSKDSWVGGYVLGEKVSGDAADWLKAVAKQFDLNKDDIIAESWHGGGMRHKGKSPYDMLTNIVTGKVKTVSGSDTVIDKGTDLQAIHDARSSRSRESDERLSNADTVEPDDLRVDIWKQDPGRVDVVGIDTPRRGKSSKSKKVSLKSRKNTQTGTQVRGLRG